MQRMGLLALLFCGMGLLYSHPLLAFKRSDQNWAYRFGPMGEDWQICPTNMPAWAVQRIKDGAAMWNYGKFQFTFGPEACLSGGTYPNGNEINQIDFGTGFPTGALAQTTRFFFTNAPDETVECDMRFKGGSSMPLSHTPTLYLAGPEVFLPNARDYAAQQRALCEHYGFRPLHPLDNGAIDGPQSVETLARLYDTVQLYRQSPLPALTALPSAAMRCAMHIYLGNIAYLRACDIVVANCNAFRGALIDDGTAYELGLANGLGKPTYGYIDATIPAVQNVVQRYPCTLQPDGIPIDQDGYLVIDDFGTAINLMLECGMLLGGGRLIAGGFAECLQALRTDLDTGALVLP